MPAARDLLRSAGALPGAVGGDQAALYRGVLRQFHDIFGFYSRKPAVAAPVGSGGVGALRLVERGVGAAGRPCGALACENGIVRAGILIGYPEKVTIFARIEFPAGAAVLLRSRRRIFRTLRAGQPACLTGRLQAAALRPY